jgi:hypothetical protein
LRESDNFEKTPAVEPSDTAAASQRLEGSVVIAPSLALVSSEKLDPSDQMDGSHAPSDSAKLAESSGIEKSAPIGESSILAPSLSVLSSDPMGKSNRFSESDNFEKTPAVDLSDTVGASQHMKSAPIRESNVLDASSGFSGSSDFLGSQDWTGSNTLAWSDAYPPTLMIRSDYLGDSPGFGHSQAPKYSLAFPRSSEITASLPYLASADFWTRIFDSERFDLTALYPASAPLTRSSGWNPSKQFGDSINMAASLAIEESAPIGKSNALNPTAPAGATSGIAGSERLANSIGFGLTAGHAPTVQAASRAFDANSDFLIASLSWLASDDPNETIGLHRSDPVGASGHFAFSSPLDKSVAFVGSMTLRTEDLGELHLSVSNQSCPAGYAAAMIIGILAIVLIGACLVISQIRAQRTSSTDGGLEMGIERSVGEEESAVSWEDEEANDSFVWENPVSDVMDDEFNDCGFSFDIEEGFRQFG